MSVSFRLRQHVSLRLSFMFCLHSLLTLAASPRFADVRRNQTVCRRPTCARQRRAEVPVWSQRLEWEVLRVQGEIWLDVRRGGAADAVPEGEVDAHS